MIKITINPEYRDKVPERYHMAILYPTDYDGVNQLSIMLLERISNKYRIPITLKEKIQIGAEARTAAITRNAEYHCRFFDIDFNA